MISVFFSPLLPTVFICLVMWQLAGKAVETKALDLEGQIQAIDSHQATALKSVGILFFSFPMSSWDQYRY